MSLRIRHSKRGVPEVSAVRGFCALIESLASADPCRGIRLIDRGLRESFHPYPELYGRVLALSGRLHAAGARRGHRVLVALSTNLESITAFFALVRLGAVPFSVSSPLVSQDRAAHRRAIVKLARLYRIDHVLAMKDLEGVAAETGAAELDPARSGADAVIPPPAAVSPDDLAFVQFSSGSTSRPKGVRITHRNLLDNLRLIVENDRRTADSVMVSWLPLYHDMGLVGGLLSNLVRHNTTVLMDPLCFLLRPINWLRAVSRHRGTLTAVPNFALDLCTDRITDEQLADEPLDLGSFRYVYNGAEPVRPESIRRFEQRFAPCGFVPGSIRPVYGMSEATLIISAPGFDDRERPVREIDGAPVPSVGRPLGDLEVRIVDERGAALGPGRVGEIRVRGTSITPGYLDAGGGPAGPTPDGWLPTGDLGLLDAAGRLYIAGRKNDLIIHQGRNYYAHDIAARIAELPGVRKGKVFVFGVEHEERERVVVMTAPPRRARGGDAEEFKTAIRRFVLREFGLPVHDVHLVGQMPKTTSGKVARHRCVDIYRRHLGLASSLLPGEAASRG